MNRVVSLPSFKSRLITLLCLWKELQELRFWYRSYNDKQYFLLYFSAYSPFTLLIWYMVYKLWNDLILFFVCTTHSSITARFLSGPSLDLLGIAIAEIIITAPEQYKGNLPGGQNLTKMCAPTSSALCTKNCLKKL